MFDFLSIPCVSIEHVHTINCACNGHNYALIIRTTVAFSDISQIMTIFIPTFLTLFYFYSNRLIFVD